jgi:8-oxo-dGTP diphosphatase
LEPEQYQTLAEQVLDYCKGRAIRVLLDVVADWAEQGGAAGVHLDSAQLRQCAGRPVGPDRYVAASCHDLDDLEQAVAIDADFAVLSPVLPTASHPLAKPLGWRRFAEVVSRAGLPVYALGGMHPEHRAVARRHGGQGIAGIRGILGG